MKVYSPADIAELLDIKQPTLRKYSIMLEERGYKIERNSQNHRYYLDKDVITLRRVITASKSGITLDEAVKNVVSIKGDNTYTNVINNSDTPNSTDISELKKMIHKQSEIIQSQGEQQEKQNELIKSLIQKLDQQQNHIDKRLNDRDKAVTEAMNILVENRKQIAIAKEQEKKEEKKGFFSRLFKKIGW